MQNSNGDGKRMPIANQLVTLTQTITKSSVAPLLRMRTGAPAGVVFV
jgi:hypothetical protein